MDDEIEDLISDLKVLSSSIEEGFNNRFWANYEKYLHDYNSMLEKTNIFIGICFDISPIKPVPSGEKAIIRVGTVAEQAKLREINVATKTLLERLNAINKKHILSDKQKLIIALIALIFGISYWATNGMYKHINDFTLSPNLPTTSPVLSSDPSSTTITSSATRLYFRTLSIARPTYEPELYAGITTLTVILMKASQVYYCKLHRHRRSIFRKSL